MTNNLARIAISVTLLRFNIMTFYIITIKNLVCMYLLIDNKM